MAICTNVESSGEPQVQTADDDLKVVEIGFGAIGTAHCAVHPDGPWTWISDKQPSSDAGPTDEGPKLPDSLKWPIRNFMATHIHSVYEKSPECSKYLILMKSVGVLEAIILKIISLYKCHDFARIKERVKQYYPDICTSVLIFVINRLIKRNIIKNSKEVKILYSIEQTYDMKMFRNSPFMYVPINNKMFKLLLFNFIYYFTIYIFFEIINQVIRKDKAIWWLIVKRLRFITAPKWR